VVEEEAGGVGEGEDGGEVVGRGGRRGERSIDRVRVMVSSAEFLARYILLCPKACDTTIFLCPKCTRCANQRANASTSSRHGATPRSLQLEWCSHLDRTSSRVHTISAGGIS